MNRADKILIGVIMLFFLISLGINQYIFARTDCLIHKSAVIRVQKETYKTIALPVDKRVTLVLEGKIGYAVVEISGEKIRMIDAPCPDKICMHRGVISSVGESIICIPNEIVIEIIAETKAVDDQTW